MATSKLVGALVLLVGLAATISISLRLLEPDSGVAVTGLASDTAPRDGLDESPIVVPDEQLVEFESRVADALMAEETGSESIATLSVVEIEELEIRLDRIAREYVAARHQAALKRAHDGQTVTSSENGADPGLVPPDNSDDDYMYVCLSEGGMYHLVELNRKEFPNVFDLADRRSDMDMLVRRAKEAGSDESATIHAGGD